MYRETVLDGSAPADPCVLVRFRPSRALIVHPRTLEMLRPLGVTDSLLERADTSPRAELHVGDRHVTLGLTDLALPDTAFPHLTLLRQMDVETVLAQALEQRGLPIERGTELAGVDHSRDDAGSLRTTLRSDGSLEHIGSRFILGCDGVASTVRRLADIACVCGPHHRAIHRGEIIVSGNADTPGGLTVTNRWGKPITTQPPKPPPNPPPTGTWHHPTGESLRHHDLNINPDPNNRGSPNPPDPPAA